MKNEKYLLITFNLILSIIFTIGLTSCTPKAEANINPYIKEWMIYKPEGISEDSINEGLNIVKNTLDKTYGYIKYQGVKKMDEEENFVYQDDIYEYSVNLDTKHLVSMFILELPASKEEKTIDKNQAIEIAQNFIKKVFEDFFDYDVDIKVDNDFSESFREFGINFKQKNELGAYTGYDVDIEMNKWGEIIFYVSLEGNPEIAKQKPKISKEKAIDIAYREAKKMVSEIIKREEKPISEVNEKAKDMGVEDITQPGDSGKYPEEPPEKAEKFRANLDERNKHKVTAELAVFKNKLQWFIEIDNVETNRDWRPIGFSISIDANTGKTLQRDHTR